MVQREYDACCLRVAVKSVQAASQDRLSFLNALRRFSPLFLELSNEIGDGHGYWKEIHSAYSDMAVSAMYMGRNSVAYRYVSKVLTYYHPWSSEAFRLAAALNRMFGRQGRASACMDVSDSLINGGGVDMKKVNFCTKGKEK
jgi:hypothetical protein